MPLYYQSAVSIPPSHPTPYPTPSMMNNKMSKARVLEIICEAVEIETEFVCEALPVDLIGMVGGLRGGGWLLCCA